MSSKKGLYTGTSNGKKKKPLTTKIKSAPTIEAVRQAQAASHAQYARPKRTKEAYVGYLDRGMKFLESLVAERRCGVGDVASDGIDTDRLEKAFDNPPNEYSVQAVEWYLVEKCFSEGRGKSTAAGIQGSFTDLWDNM